MADQPDRAVDEGSISPIKERRDSLEKHLQRRPDPQELKDRNILMDINAAPSLQSTAHELERQRAADNLRKGLEKRPEREELIERNILPDSNAAPALLGHQKELEKHMRANSLDKKIQQRPSPEDLVKEGILEPNDDPTKD